MIWAVRSVVSPNTISSCDGFFAGSIAKAVRKISAIVPGAIGREEVLKAGRAMRVLRRWPEVVGEAMAARSAPERYDRGTVWIAVTGSAWAQELRMSKGIILNKLHGLAHENGLFQDLRFGVRPLPEPVPEEDGALSKRKAEYANSLRDLSIREIAERRLKKSE
jgi:hypothetical protein